MKNQGNFFSRGSQLAFTRTIGATYAVTLVVLFLRVEVNILGRYLFLDSNSLNENEEEEVKSCSIFVIIKEQFLSISQETQKKYLAYSDYVKGNGLKNMITFIASKVGEEMINWPLQKTYSLEDLIQMVTNIRSRVEGSQIYA